MAQYIKNTSKYKALGVVTPPQELAQNRRKLPQMAAAQDFEDAIVVEDRSLNKTVAQGGESLLVAIIDLVGGVFKFAAQEIEIARKSRAKSAFRRKMAQEVRREDEYIRSFKKAKTKCNPVIQVNNYGGENTVNINL